MPSSPGSFRQVWYRWKSLKLPWRNQWLCGFDLAGNTFWEFKDQINARKFRRIVKFTRRTHYGDVKISPQWLQWLRHTREEAPTIAEQEYDIVRQRQMKLLAAAADERWASKPSTLDPPARPQPLTIGEMNNANQTPSDNTESINDNSGLSQRPGHPADPSESRQGRKKESGKEKSPWNLQRGNPGDDWQPTAWSPGTKSRQA